MARIISARWQSIALVALLSLLFLYSVLSITRRPKTTAWQSLPAVDKSPRTGLSSQSPEAYPSEGENVSQIRYAGHDIVIVTGSDGHHDLQNHADEILGNREDYAALYGNFTYPLCLPY